MKKKLKAEYQPGGSKRHVILDKAVQYLKDPKFGLQGDKMHFLMEELGLSQSEYLTCLNDAAGGNYWNEYQDPWQWVVDQEHQWPGYTWAIGDGSRHRDQATSTKPQAASAKPQAWQETYIML